MTAATNMKMLLQVRADTKQARSELQQLPALAKRLAVALAGAFTVKKAYQLAEAYTEIRNRLALVTSGTEELNMVQNSLFAVAQNARQPLSDTAELYQRIATNQKELGLNSTQVIEVVETISKSLAISGTSAQSASAALVQLGQAFASGTLRGDELNSVLEQAPALTQAIARGLGITVGQLRTLGQEGKLSAKNVIDALQAQGVAVDEQFGKIQVTGSQAMTALGNSIMQMVGEIDQATNSSSSFASAMQSLSEWLDTGVLTEAAIDVMITWQETFRAIANEVINAQDAFNDLSEASGDAASFIGRAFRDLPLNIKSGIQILVVEVMAGFDKLVVYAQYCWQAIQSVFTDVTYQATTATRDQALKLINQVRDESIAQITNKIDQVSAKRKATKEQRSHKQVASAQQLREASQSRLRNQGKTITLDAKGKDQAKRAKTSEEQRFIEQLERQAQAAGKTEAQIRRLMLAKYQLSAAQRQAAENALRAIEAFEQQEQAQKNAADNAGLQAELLRAQGKQIDAASLELQTKFTQMRQEFEKNSNATGLALIDKLIPVQQAKIKLDEVQRLIQQAQAKQQQSESSVQVQQDTGVINEMQAREQILAIHQQTHAKLLEMRPLLQELAQMPGEVGLAASAALAQLEVEMARLQTTTTLLQTTLRDGLTQGFTQALSGLAKGTMDLREAITALAQSVLDALVQMAAQNLAQSAASSVMGLFGGAGNAGGEAAGAAATSAAAAQLTAASAGLTTSATGLTAGASQLMLASSGLSPGGIAIGGAAQQLITAGGGLQSGAVAIGIAAGKLMTANTAASVGKAAAFATGGYVCGKGTGTSDDIPAWLSNGEFVTRAAVVQQPGALPFLQAFNRNGMSAVASMLKRVKHATGGLAGMPAPNMSAPALANVSLASPSVNTSTKVENAQNFYLIDDPARISDALKSEKGKEAIILHISRDPAKFRAILG